MDGFTAGLWSDLAGSIHVALVVPGPIDTGDLGKDDTPSGYNGLKVPPEDGATDATEVIERRSTSAVPRFSAQPVSAHLLRFFAPSPLAARV